MLAADTERNTNTRALISTLLPTDLPLHKICKKRKINYSFRKRNIILKIVIFH